jgi:hypothetical protein
MKYFKDLQNNIYAYDDDGSQDEIIPSDLIAISESDANELRAVNAPDPRSSMIVTAFQAKAAIGRIGLYDQVETLMSNPDTPFEIALAWREVLTFKRLSPTVVAMGAALGLSDAQLDDLFVLAATIDA